MQAGGLITCTLLVGTLPICMLAQRPVAKPVPATLVTTAKESTTPDMAMFFDADGLMPSGAATMSSADLPNEPGWTLPPPPPPLPPCPAATPNHASVAAKASDGSPVAAGFVQPCIQINPYKRFLDATTPVPLKPSQKAYLALRNFRDPANLITIFGTAAFTIGTNAHTAYGPGWSGFARNSAYSFSQDATGEFFGTFLIPSLAHEDPHYHRLPHATIPHRVLHAIARTAIAQHDDGSLMPNYAVLLTYPLSAELSNLYVPGIHGNGPSTVKRVATGLATDPVNNLITEFLPDVAKRVNIRVVFVQRVMNMMTAGASTGAISQ